MTTSDQELEQAISSLIRNHSSPTIGRGDIHGGQRGFILYEAGLAFVIAGIKRHMRKQDLPTADDLGRLCADLREALDLALCQLSKLEPGDSRAVSDEFVAMTAVFAGGRSSAVMSIIRRALAAERQSDADAADGAIPSGSNTGPNGPVSAAA